MNKQNVVMFLGLGLVVLVLSGCNVGMEDSSFGSLKRAQLYVEESGVSYSAFVTYMPDLDQGRKASSSERVRGLPNDGKMYCGAAAAMNLLSFLGQNGYPSLMPGATDYAPIDENVPLSKIWKEENRKRYNQMTQFLSQLGAVLKTSPTEGTNSSDLVAGLGRTLGSDFKVTREGSRYCNESKVVGPQDLFDHLKAGRLVLMHYGKYKLNEQGYMEHVGGHYVTMTGVRKTLMNATIMYRDSNRDNQVNDTDYLRQSPFRTEVIDIKKERIKHSESCSLERWRLIRPNASSTYRYYMEWFIVVEGPRPLY